VNAERAMKLLYIKGEGEGRKNGEWNMSFLLSSKEFESRGSVVTEGTIKAKKFEQDWETLFSKGPCL
jgi:hypothetical protein